MISTSKKIMANERFRTYCLFLCILPLTIFGCQSISVLPTEDVTTQAIPYIHAGPLHVLLKMPTGLDKVKVLVDNTGLAYIFISSIRINEVHHVVLGPDGVIERELIKSSVDTLNLDAAFDRSGRLHVLIGNEHMIKQEGSWVAVERTPWEELGLTIKRPGFVAGARDLTWAFLIGGQEVGTAGRWDWFGIAGGYPPLGLIWPWHTQADKLMIVPEMAPTYTTWMVLEPESNFDTDLWAFGTDGQGAIHVAYEQSRPNVMMQYGEISHAKFVIEPDRTAPPTASSDVTAPLRERRQLQAIPGGRAIGYNKSPTFIYPPVSIAIDPDSGTTLVVRRSGGFEEFFQLREAGPRGFLVRDEEWSAAIPMAVSNVMKTSVAPSGNDRFHAVVVGEPSNFWTGGDNPIYYLNLTSNVWSPPVTLGLANNSHWIFKGLVDSVEVASNGRRRAVVVWPTDEGIVGRWIELLQ
ncbi:MAG TPA: hypothetical protein VGQ79_01535 [Nitrospiraceae bacterium]|jgi:hypothetical protein|nr:hypothetical protein [Nitrospiraceae bacterium]